MPEPGRPPFLPPLVPPAVVATDLDGTLLRTDGTVSTRTRAALAATEAAGIATILVTARPPRRVDELGGVVGPHGVAICGNGAFVYDVRSREVTEDHCIDPEVLTDVVADLRAAIPQIVFAVEGRHGMGREPGFVTRAEIPPPRTVAGLEDLVDLGVGKLLGRCEELDATTFHARVSEVVAGRVELGYSGAVGLAEITALGVTKAAGLARWCGDRGIAAEDVWAFGDMPNDLPMLRWAGTSFGVGNGHPDVLDVATHVCASNDEDGVAEVLEAIAAPGGRVLDPGPAS